MFPLWQITQILLNPPRQRFLEPPLALGEATKELEIYGVTPFFLTQTIKCKLNS